MKIVLQHDERDCGASCLSMIAAHYKLFLPLSKLREITKTDNTGTNLYGIVEGANKLGFYSEALSGNPKDLLNGIAKGDIKFPFIAHVVNESAMLHFVVVFGYNNDSFIIGDPGKGKLSVKVDSFLEQWTGYIVTFKVSESFKKGNHTRGSFFKFFYLMKGQWGRLTSILIISIVIASIGIIGAFIFQLVIDNFASEQGYYEEHSEELIDEEALYDDGHNHEDAEEHNHEGEPALVRFLEKATENFNMIFIGLLLLYFLQAIIQFLRGWLIIQVSKTIDLRLTLSYYQRIVDLPMSSLSVRQTGEYLSRFSDSVSIRQAISGATVTLLLDSLMTVAGGIILFMESRQLFAISLGMVVCYIILVLLYRKPVERLNRRVMQEDASLQSYFKESIDGMETVKASCAGEQVKEKTRQKFNRFLDTIVSSGLLSVSQDTLAGIIELVGTVLILWLGFSMVLSGQITIGVLVTFYVLLAYFTEPIKNLAELQPTIQTAFVAAERLNDILDLEPEQTGNYDNSQNAEIPEDMKCWEARHIDFRYGNRELTLHDVSFQINRGERIAIVGESGSGKTTLAKLFLRFYEPESGEVILDGRNISEYNLNALRKSIAYVGQNTFLFSDSIRSNLMLGNPTLTEDELKRVCEISKSANFIQDLPLGYDMPLDENGINLSGGQRQRLAIARALARHPQLLILDEATSNLDTVTENGIRDTIFNLDRNMTCIIIAHRLTTIRSCDRIYVMKDGTVEETGTYDELMNKRGEFYRLWNAM